MAEVAHRDVETISNMSGDTLLLTDDDVEITPADQPIVNLSSLLEQQTDPSVSNIATTASRSPHVSYAGAAASGTPRVNENELLAPRAYRNEYFLSSFEREHFHPDNVTPDRPCTAYFQSAVFNDSSAVFDALKAQGFPESSVRCLQRRPTGEMLITFSSSQVKNSFVKNNSIQIQRRRYAINDSDRFLTYLNIYDAPHEMSDNALIKRLEPYCEVVSYRRGRLQTNKSVFNGNRHFRVRVRAAIPSYLRFGKFLVRLSHSGQEHTCRRCNRLGHFANECPNTICFNCEELGHVAEECPHEELCCICKESSHRARFCRFSWYRDVSPSSSPAPQRQDLQQDTRDTRRDAPLDTHPPDTHPPDPPISSLPPSDSQPPPASEDSEQLLDAAGLLRLRELFADDDDLASLSSSSSDDESDNDDDADVADDDDNGDDNDDRAVDDNDTQVDNNNDDDDDMFTSEAGKPESASAGPASIGMPESASADLDPPGDPERISTEPTDDSPPDNTPMESQPLFSSSEPQSQTSSLDLDPESQPSKSRFGPMRRSLFSRRNPAPMPEALAAIHRRATAPAPIPTGSASRDRSPVSVDPPDATPPLPDLGIPDPGSAT